MRARDVAVVPAAAGGPKGLIFQHLDQWLFGAWLAGAPRQRSLVGSSIGAWRLAAACHANPADALARLGRLYCDQTYSAKPGPQEVQRVCAQLLADFIQGHEHEVIAHPQHRLHVLAVRGKRLLAAPAGRAAQLGGFAAAGLLNLGSRAALGQLLERVVIGDARDPAPWLRARFDRFTTHFAALDTANLAAALLASGTLPLVMDPVRALHGAPPGLYWDGGLIDYNLALPYARMDGAAEGELVLYPHFGEHIVPGWLDKGLRWRRAARGPQGHWLDNVLIVAPSAAFLATLPRAKLPDRQDFKHYGLDHAARAANWRRAIGQGERLRDELAAFAERPELARVAPL
ncbi:MAG: patatin-like phospholipase family protein [Pseudomonadota bacterium]